MRAYGLACGRDKLLDFACDALLEPFTQLRDAEKASFEAMSNEVEMGGEAVGGKRDTTQRIFTTLRYEDLMQVRESWTLRRIDTEEYHG